MNRPTKTQTSPWLEPISAAEQKQLAVASTEVDDIEDTPDPGWAGNRLLAYSGIAKAAAWFVGGFVGLQAAMLVVGAGQLHWSLGLGAGLLVGIPGVWLIHKLWRARRNMRRVEALEGLRIEAGQLRVGAVDGVFGPWSEQVKSLLPSSSAWFSRLAQRTGEYANDNERFDYFDQLLAAQCDQQAQAAVVRATRRTALGVAASPFLALDLILAVAGNLSLIGQVARAYGLPPSPFLETRLLLQVYRQIATMGAIELGSEVAGQALSHEVLARLSGRVAQGFSAGLYTYRIGITAMSLCRPLAFSEQTKPRPGRLFADLFKKLEGEV